MNKCIDVFGWLFGHKYMKSAGGYVFRHDCCYRCGKRREA